jgi:predicted nucleotidyltransferase
MNAPIEIDQKQLSQFCRRNHIERLSLFGSVLRDDFGPKSDLDVLVEFEPDHVPGLLGITGMELELEEIVGRKVDLRTPSDLSKYFRQEVIESAVLQYAS